MNIIDIKLGKCQKVYNGKILEHNGLKPNGSYSVNYRCALEIKLVNLQMIINTNLATWLYIILDIY